MNLFGKNTRSNGGIPRDENGMPYYLYWKEKDRINGIENYIYHITGNGTYRPTEIEGKPIPVGSTFFDWKTWTLYYMRNWGWATKDDPDPVIPVVKPVLSALSVDVNGTEIEATLGSDDTMTIDLSGAEAGANATLKSFEADIEADIWLVDNTTEAIVSKLHLNDPIFVVAIPSVSFKLLVVKKGKVPGAVEDGTLWEGVASNLVKPVLTSFSVDTDSTGELAGTIDGNTIKVNSTDMTSAEVVRLSSFEADTPAKLYEYNPDTQALLRSVETGNALCTLFSKAGQVNIVAISSSLENPQSAEDGTTYSVVIDATIRRIHFLTSGTLINGEESEDGSKYIDVEAYSRVELNVTFKVGYTAPSTLEQFEAMVAMYQEAGGAPELPMEYSKDGDTFKIIFPNMGGVGGGNVHVSVVATNVFELYDLRTEPDYPWNVTLTDMVNCIPYEEDPSGNPKSYEAVNFVKTSFTIKDATTGDPVPNIDSAYDLPLPSDFSYDPSTGHCEFTLTPDFARTMLYTGTFPENKKDLKNIGKKKVTKSKAKSKKKARKGK